MSTLLCVPILVLDEHTALADAAAARDGGADLVEFRIDEIFTGAMDSHGNLDDREVRAVLRLVAQSPLPCIVTCRSAEESGGTGGYDGDDAARIALYERLGTAEPRSSRRDPAVPGEHPPRYLDLEYATYGRSANIRQKIHLAIDHPNHHRDVRTGLILSTHDFSGRPRDLLRRLALMQSEDAASIIKVAYTARSVRDNLELFDLLIDNAEGGGGGGVSGSKPMIALAMGRFGLLSRALAPKFGGFLTFAALRPSAATAPGQPSLSQLVDHLRFRSITPRTRIYGIIGWPVEHSISPIVHNAGFEAISPDVPQRGAGGRAVGFDGVYLPIPVPPEWEHFKATLGALIDHPRLDFSGCSVTVPHKQHLVRFAREAMQAGSDGIAWSIDDLSHLCGAANTLIIERERIGDGRDSRPVAARVLNTDAPAAAACLRQALGDLQHRRLALLGAGGVARAIAASAALAGADITIFNRTLDSARALAANLAAALSERSLAPGDVGALHAADLADFGASSDSGPPFDAVINCTPVGMAGHDPVTPGGSAASKNRMPVSIEQLVAACGRSDRQPVGGAAVVFDTIYTPLRTPLLEAAARHGFRTVDGLGMFVAQAAAQFEAWTASPAPVRLFERIAKEALEERMSS